MYVSDWTDELTQTCIQRHESAFKASGLSCSSYMGVCKDDGGKCALLTVSKASATRVGWVWGGCGFHTCAGLIGVVCVCAGRAVPV